MNALEVLLSMVVLRLVLPLGLLLWIGENARRRQLTDLHRLAGSL
jgi:hypothetical protein